MIEYYSNSKIIFCPFIWLVTLIQNGEHFRPSTRNINRGPSRIETNARTSSSEVELQDDGNCDSLKSYNKAWSQLKPNICRMLGNQSMDICILKHALLVKCRFHFTLLLNIRSFRKMFNCTWNLSHIWISPLFQAAKSFVVHSPT